MASLFSKSAIKKAVSMFDRLNIEKEISIVQELYEDFKKWNMKDETRYEQNFNELFFHQLLGYDPKINLHPKASTPVGSKIADLGLGFFDDGLYQYEWVKVVVEFKGSDTNLDKKQASYGGQSPVDQWFWYKTSFKNCPWLIVSNFASVRLYRDNKQDFEVWTIEQLADLTHDYYNLRTLLGILKKNHLIHQTTSSFSENLLSEVRIHQETITKTFYKDYKALRLALINDIRHHNPTVSVEVVVEKAQKIIDRIIFIHFCEDKELLPEGKLKTNVIRAREVDFSPWDVLKKYFAWVDRGSEKLEIPNGYNGWLFHDDPELNSLEIGDAICHKFIDLGNYNFDDELSVNILGHIFEQSISDIEQLKWELLGTDITTDELVEKKESKRKKDGIFYTPEYIVDYIVQNSLMKYLEEKESTCLDKVGKKWWYKTDEEAYQAYQHILQNIKVLDPACGSGAFLVRVFDYLYAENKRVWEIVGGLFSTDEIYKSILRNNIYGVDLNPESVEITKLSLWLKSAQKGKKLNNLDDNIKCGNSLIDDPAVAGERAFDWNKEFAEIMGSWGFDVIVGNPPYGVNFDETTKKYLVNFDNSVPDYEIYIYFISLYKKILSKNWYLSYIFPNTFLSTLFGIKYRTQLFEDVSLTEIVDLSHDNTFVDASVRTIIFTFRNHDTNYKTQFTKIIGKQFINHENYEKNHILSSIDNVFSLFSQNQSDINIIKKIIKYKSLKEFYEISQWLIPYDKYRWHDELTIKNRIWHSNYCKDNTYKKELKWWDVSPYSINWNGELWISYWDWLAAPRDKKFFTLERILVREITWEKLYCCYTDEEYYNTPSLINIINEKNILNLKYSLSILNSKLIWRYHNKTSPKANKGLFPKILVNDVRNIPIPNIPLSAQQPFIEKADLMLSLNKEFHDKTDSFLRYISSKFWLEKLSEKLLKFHDYNFATFLKELKSKKLSMSEEAELIEFFENKKSEIISLKNRIDATDRDIDDMVFDLYRLSDEERKVVLDL